MEKTVRMSKEVFLDLWAFRGVGLIPPPVHADEWEEGEYRIELPSVGNSSNLELALHRMALKIAAADPGNKDPNAPWHAMRAVVEGHIIGNIEPHDPLVITLWKMKLSEARELVARLNEGVPGNPTYFIMGQIEKPGQYYLQTNPKSTIRWQHSPRYSGRVSGFDRPHHHAHPPNRRHARIQDQLEVLRPD